MGHFLWILFWAPLALASVSAEYHWTVCEGGYSSIVKKLGAASGEGKQRTVYYLDTADRAYYRGGVIFRFRGEAGEPLEATVKVKVDPDEVPGGFFSMDGFKCEGDYLGSKVNVRCSLEEEIDLNDFKAYLRGELEAEELFSSAQKKLLKGAGVRVDWDRLRPVGPTQNKKWKLKGSSGKFDLEAYRSRAGTEIWELSQKNDSGSVSDFRKRTSQLQKLGVKLCGTQSSKTAFALGVSTGR